jgi:hypothetical protein
VAEKSVRDILAQVTTQYEKLGDLIEELQAAVDREPTVGQEAKRCLDYFVANWERKYPGEKYVVNGAKDMASLKRLLRTLTPEQIAERVRGYFKLSDPFIANGRWSLPLFVSSINKISTSNPSTYVIGCSHTPRCGSDAQHTQLHLQQQRQRGA